MTQNGQLQEASFATKRSLPPRRGRCSSTRVGTRQARRMDTPKANRHSSTRVGTRQARGMDTPKANKLQVNKVDSEFATNGTVALVRTGGGERGAH